MSVVSRPGGRTAETTRRIFAATLALLVEGGLAACGFLAVAERAGVGRATLYRRWSSRAALVLDALAAHLEGAVSVRDTGSFATDLRALVDDIASFLQSPLGRAAVAAVAEQRMEDALEPTSFWRARLTAVTPVFERAVARGEVAADCDREALLACALGPLYFRTLVMGMPIDVNWVDRVFRQLFDNRAGRVAGTRAPG